MLYFVEEQEKFLREIGRKNGTFPEILTKVRLLNNKLTNACSQRYYRVLLKKKICLNVLPVLW